MDSVFHCVPQRKIWDPSVKGYSLNRNASYIAAATLNVLVDLVILFLPFPMLRKLHTTSENNFGRSFFYGLLVSAISITSPKVMADLSIALL